MALLDLLSIKAPLSSPPAAVKLLLPVTAPLVEVSAAEAAKFETRTGKHFLLRGLLWRTGRGEVGARNGIFLWLAMI